MMRNQKGMSIIETMISLAILSFGLIGAVKMQLNMSVADQLARQRSEAVRLARDKLEEFRLIPPTASVTGTETKEIKQASARYVSSWAVTYHNTASDGVPTKVVMKVTWDDLRKVTKADGTNSETNQENKVEFETSL